MSSHPRRWTNGRLGDVVELTTGFPFKSSDYAQSPGVRLLRGDNVAQQRIRWDGAKYWSANDPEVQAYGLAVGDVVVAMDRPWIEAGLKASRITEGDVPSLLVQRVARMRAGPALDQVFLHYVVQAPGFVQHVKSVHTGTAVPHISGAQIREYQFLLPPLEEQRRIAGVLGALDDLACANVEEAARLDSLADALGSRFMRDLRVDTVVPLSEVADVSKGYSYKSSELMPGKGRWLVNLKNVGRGGSFQPRGFKPLGGDPKPKHFIDGGDIVVAQTDLTQARDVIGRPVRVRRGRLKGDLIASLDLVVVRPKSGMNREYLMAALSTPTFRDHALGRCNGTTVLHMAAGTVPSFTVPLPDQSALASLQGSVAPLREAADAAFVGAEEVASVRDELLPLLMSGRVRVGEATV